MGWTVTHQISEQLAIDLLRTGTKPPLAIILVGSNDQSKEKVAGGIVAKLGGSIYEIDYESSLTCLTTRVLDAHTPAIIDLTNGTGASHDFRQRVVRQLRASGANTIAIIWIKDNNGDYATDKIHQAMLKAPPTAAEDIQYLFELAP